MIPIRGLALATLKTLFASELLTQKPPKMQPNSIPHSCKIVPTAIQKNILANIDNCFDWHLFSEMSTFAGHHENVHSTMCFLRTEPRSTSFKKHTKRLDIMSNLWRNLPVGLWKALMKNIHKKHNIRTPEIQTNHYFGVPPERGAKDEQTKLW